MGKKLTVEEKMFNGLCDAFGAVLTGTSSKEEMIALLDKGIGYLEYCKKIDS